MRYPLTILVLLSLAGPAVAEEDGVEPEFEFGDAYQFGINRHELDDHTRVTGWRISQKWYFGQQRGRDSGFGFVWQRDADQMSISTDGIRFTRRF